MRSPRPLALRVTICLAAASLAAGWALFAWGASASGRPEAGAQPSSEQVALGRTLYQERCATCHGPTGGGAPQGPSIVGLGPASYDFMMSTGRMPAQRSVVCRGCSAAEFATKIEITRRRPVLSPSQIRAVTAFLVSLAPGVGEPIPRTDPAAGNLPEGAILYQGSCAPCHGWDAIGGAVGPQDAPSLHHSTDTQVAEAVRIGPGTMPRFGEAVVDQAKLDSLVRYVRYLRDPVDRGGAGLSHVGPLIEGFVGLGIGLGLIIVATRYMGTRS